MAEREALTEAGKSMDQRDRPRVSPVVGGQATTDLALLLSDGDLTRVSFSSHRQWLGSLVVLMKTGLRRLLMPILERQTSYNAANARIIAALKDEVSALWAAQLQRGSIGLQLEREAIKANAERPLPSMPPLRIDNLPTAPDDPRLENWYHTIELADDLVSRGVYDHRPILDCYGLPESLAGKACLDVGTGDGFFAFEMERRGAARVVAIDIASCEDYEILPHVRARMKLPDEGPHRFKFDMARVMRRSRVEFKVCSVYDLSPETVGMFDVVFCGSLLLHLQNPLQALVNIRAVTREMAVIETMVDPELEERFPEKPWLSFGLRDVEVVLGESCVYWRMTTKALEDMLAYAGFAETRPQKPFRLPPLMHIVTAVTAYPRPRGEDGSSAKSAPSG